LNNNIINNTALPTVISRGAHDISLAGISDAAIKVINRLQLANHEVYLVGGAVRDLLLGRVPKDFDISTDALPEEVHKIFRNSRIIGRRFRLVHVRFGREIIEVATFRGHHDSEENQTEHDAKILDGMIVRDNVFGSLKEDAWRRDVTVNSLYYGLHDDTVLDYTGGITDLKNNTIRIIGDAERRYQEDPVRMLRVVRFASKLGFEIESKTSAPIMTLAGRLTAVPPARLFDEVLKLFMSGHAVRTYELLRQYGLFEHLFPLADVYLDDPNSSLNDLLVNGFTHTDDRIKIGKPVTPAYLFAVLLWKPMWEHAKKLQASGVSPIQSIQIAGNEIISRQSDSVSLPKRFSLQTREIWVMQCKLLNRSGKKAFRTFEQVRFRAGYDFLLLRAESGEDSLTPLCDWWTEFQEKNEQQRANLVQQVNADNTRKKRPRKRRKP